MFVRMYVQARTHECIHTHAYRQGHPGPYDPLPAHSRGLERPPPPACVRVHVHQGSAHTGARVRHAHIETAGAGSHLRDDRGKRGLLRTDKALDLLRGVVQPRQHGGGPSSDARPRLFECRGCGRGRALHLIREPLDQRHLRGAVLRREQGEILLSLVRQFRCGVNPGCLLGHRGLVRLHHLREGELERRHLETSKQNCQEHVLASNSCATAGLCAVACSGTMCVRVGALLRLM